jgi:hypothetical protein
VQRYMCRSLLTNEVLDPLMSGGENGRITVPGA